MVEGIWDGSKLSSMSIIGGTFAHSELTSFPADLEFIHNFFRQAKENPNFAGVLDRFVFSFDVGPYPFSLSLQGTIDRLLLARSILRETRRPVTFSMTASAIEREKKLLTQETPEAAHVIIRLGVEFRKACEQFVPV